MAAGTVAPGASAPAGGSPGPTQLLFAPDARYTRRRAYSTFMRGLVSAAALLGVAVLWIILAYVIIRGLPALNLPFFTQRPLPYGQVGGGVGPALVGSLILMAVSAVIGVPVGVGAGIYLSEYGRGRFADAIRFSSDLIAGMPSIVIGVFIWAWLVRTVIGNFSGLAGAIALAVIMVPIILRTVEEVLRLVPHTLREAALALGVPQWRVILGIVLPAARAGIITGVVLSLARAGGETAPLLLTALGNQFFSFNLLQPMAALPVQIYNYAVAPYEDWHTKAWGGALVLISLIGALSVIARYATRGNRLG
ncbi:MAG TPA: phosphate ABC transporter permease PstA [Chloroflexota bacterium]|jgi:phosphate transport system permease protein|nr:phosphate ABC transporter permease PstA [Chloroflexota bacterium]